MDEKNQNLKRNSDIKNRIIVFGLIVHVLLLFAVFDIYFSSPIDHGMNLIKSTENPPAKRLVLFVADGLRAESVFDEKSNRIPFLKSVMDNIGSWGTAHTRVPTESRPGHVAILAGIYEDPSAILKGWKSNPVNFDSVLNQSTNAWCWGSPDILNVFNKDNSPHIRLHSYSAELEDFGENDTSLLDDWVFKKVDSFLETKVAKCVKNCNIYEQSGTIFFLHLLGLDTAGHGFKPHSEEYVRNIRFVDANVKKTFEHFETLFDDQMTAYVFTSDHGMTDWGSHGTGSPHETETPIIAWGAGIKRNPSKQDINQIDVVPLLASLIGLNIPSNSLGVVPLSYLDMAEKDLAQVQLSNTLQLLETFNIKRLRTERNALIFVPYKGLRSSVLSRKVLRLRKLQAEKQYSVVIEECRSFMISLVEGLDYYHNYYQYPLLILVSIGLVEWILYLVACGMDSNLPSAYLNKRGIYILTVFNAVPIILCYIQKFPMSYYLYFSFPFAMFTTLYPHFPKVSMAFKLLRKSAEFDRGKNVLIYVVGTELLVFGFFHRYSFSILSLLIGLWVFVSDSLNKRTTKEDKVLWATLCAVMAIFPSLPVMKTTFNVNMYALGGVAWILLFRTFLLKLLDRQASIIEYRIMCCQFFFLIVAIIYSLAIEKGYIANNSNLKYIAWFISLIPIAMIPLTNQFLGFRLEAIFFGFGPFYLLVSSNYEVVFLAAYVAILCQWLLIEIKSFKGTRTAWNFILFMPFGEYNTLLKAKSDMYRRAFLFMVFIFVGFFGTGNIASLNSFDPMWVRAFLTVFSPFKMAGLILLKIMIPFLFTCCVFSAINTVGSERTAQVFCVVLFFSDSMVLQFLYLITNKGSWLDIGSSLSHFVIMEAFVIILLLLYSFAHVLTTVTYCRRQLRF